MAPKVVVLYGGHAFERARGLLNGMINRPHDLNGYGRVMVDLMAAENLTTRDVADHIQPFLRQFTLPDSEDPGFDERIMFEALTFGAKMFKQAWYEQVETLHGISCRDYRFNRWLGVDLVLERRDSL